MTAESTEVISSVAPAQPVDIPAVVAGLRKTFATGRTRPVEWRRTQLRALERMIADNEALIAEALATDLGRKPFEAWLADIASTIAEARDAAKNVGKWTKRRHRLLENSQLPGRGWIEYEPYGTVLVIGAWNFPFALTLGPLVGAIAAGNTVLLKPSELAPASSRLMAELVARYLDSDAIAVIEGDGAVSQELIAQGFDKLCFTGGTEIGRKVYESAATHLTPVTLELGGKSPVIVAADADVATAAKRIAWTKLINSGQICIAPDYVLADASVRDELVTKISDAIRTFRAEDTGGMRIVNERHFGRLTSCPGRHQRDGRDRRWIGCGEPADRADRGRRSGSRRAADDRRDLRTRSCRCSPSGTSMRRSRSSTRGPSRWRPTCSPRPSRVRERVIKEVPAGGMLVNHLIFQFATAKLPFGGVGPSGMGAYHGRFGFEEFSHRKSVLTKPTRPDLSAVIYPPYTEKAWKLARRLF